MLKANAWILSLALLVAVLPNPSVLSAQLTGRAAAEAISSLTQPRAASIAGNSVDTGTGGMSFEATVMQVQGGRLLDFTLMQDSIITPAFIVGVPLLVGNGWTHAYSARLVGASGFPVTVHWDDHRRNRFAFQAGAYVPVDESARYDRLREVNGSRGCGECRWEAIREDGTLYLFDANGILKRIGNKIDQLIEVEKVNGRVLRITEPISDREIEFFYGRFGRIRYLLDPAERRAYLEYDERGRLSTVHNPARVSDVFGGAFVPVPIPDAGAGTLERPINVNGLDKPVGVAILETTNVEHARRADIRIFLRSPAGTEVEFTDLASSTTEFVYDFDGVASGGFHGEDGNGQWVLRIVDERTGQAGRLNGFRLRFSGPTYPTRFTYQEVGLISEAIDSSGRRIFANQFDSRGRVIAQDDGLDSTPLATLSYQESPDGVVTTYTDRLGFEYVYEHDNNYRLVRNTDPLVAETLYEYASNGDRTAIVDALGRRTEFAYDSTGNITRVTDAAGNVTRMTYTSPKNLSTFTDAEGARTSFVFNQGNITAVTDAEGIRDERSYGANGQLTNVLLEDGAGLDLGYTRGQPSSAQMLRGPMTGAAGYDEIGLVSTIEDGMGNEIGVEYDDRGNVIRRTDPLGVDETMEYDERNRLVRSVDKRGNETRFEYDANNNLIRRTNALGEMAEFAYDAADRLVQAIDARGGLTERTYDEVGRVVAETNAVGETVRRRYDTVGNLIAMIDANGDQVAGIAYDQLDLPVATTDAAGGVSQTRYDAVQRPIELTDALGRSTMLTYDQIGRLARVDDPLGRTTTQSYLSDDVVESLTDGTGDETSFSYDQQNRVSQFTPPNGSVASQRWDYDNRGLPTRERLPGGVEKNYDYDDAGRLTELSYSGAGARPTRQYSYDASANLTQVRVGGSSQLRRTFDSLNRVVSFTDAHGDTLRYDYDPNGNLARLTYPDGKTVEYTYDEANRLVSLVDWAERQSSFSYDSNSLLTGITFPNGTTRSMEFDAAGRLIRRRDLTASGTPIVDYSYRYDAVGLMTEEMNGLSAPPPYQPAAMTFTYGVGGRFTSINGSAATYDARGNLTSIPSGSGSASLTYDADNNLAGGPGATSYEYDAEDRLISWTTPGGRTRFTVDPHGPLDQLLVERSASSATTRFVYGGGLLYEEGRNGIRVYHYDQRGSAIAFSGGSGSVVGQVSYGPFGDVIASSGETDSIFKFCGLYGVVTAPSGLNYMRYRWYSPELKRFLSPDSRYGEIVDPASLNRYVYAANNPVNFVDPNGEFLGALVGAVAGAVVNTVTTVVVAVVTNQPLTAGDLIGAAVGGAITGGLIGACGPACAGAGATIAAGIGASIAGGAAGNALGQGIDLLTGAQTGGFDTGDFAVEVAASAVFGALPFGKGGKAVARGVKRGAGEAGEALAKRGSRASTSKLLRGVGTAPGPGGSAPIALPYRASLKGAGKPAGGGVPSVVKSAGPGGVSPIAVPGARAAASAGAAAARSNGALVKDIGAAIGQGIFVNIVAPDTDAPPPGSPGASRDAFTVQQSGLRELNAGQRGVFGEYAAWRFYQAVHTLAGRPLPNNPNPAFPQF